MWGLNSYPKAALYPCHLPLRPAVLLLQGLPLPLSSRLILSR